MNILVISPDDDIGCRVVSELLSPEFKVRVITNDLADLPEEWDKQVEVIADPMENTSTLRRALVDMDAVLWCLPTKAKQEVEPLAHALSRAVRDLGTPRLVTISTMDCGFIGNADIISIQSSLEAILNESKTAIRHLHCDLLKEKRFSLEQSSLEFAAFSLSISGDILFAPMAVDDIVDMALKCLVRQDWGGVERLAVVDSKPALV